MRDEVRQAVVERTSKIEKESRENPLHEWAGTYRQQFHLAGTSLAIAPKAGATRQFWGCMGLYDQNIGTVTEKDGRISIRWDFEFDDWPGPEAIFVLVRWGDRRYLIEEGRILEFCEVSRKPRDPAEDRSRFDLYFLRKGGEPRPFSGEPVLPKAYQKYLTMDPIKASILSTGPATTTRHTTYPDNYETVRLVAKLNAGSAEHVLPTMEFRPVEPNERFSIRVLRVREHECEAEVSFDQPIGTKAPAPKVGAKVVSRRWNDL